MTRALVRLGRLVCAAAVSLSTVVASPAATQVSGNVSGTWNKAGSPYVLVDNCSVPAGTTLTIEPGTTVILGESLRLKVLGGLVATGTPNARITFKSPLATLYYDTIELNYGGSEPQVSYCDFSGGLRLLTVSADPATAGSRTLRVTLHQCTFSRARDGALLASAAGSYSVGRGGVQSYLPTAEVLLENCSLEDVPEGVTLAASGDRYNYPGGHADYPGVVRLFARNSLFAGVSGSALVTRQSGPAGDSSVQVRNCILRGCGTGVDTVSTFRGTIANCVFYQCGRGAIGASATEFIIRNTVFQACGTALTKAPAIPADASYNSFFGNGTNFVGYPGSYGGVVWTNDNGTPADLSFNIFVDPLLIPAPDLVPGAQSPCIDGGSPGAESSDAAFPPSQGTARNDIGAYGGPGATRSVGVSTSDADGDGLLDEWEVRYFGGLDPQPSDDRDRDGLENASEAELGTDPTKADSDGDGFSDGSEFRAPSDPLDVRSTPPPTLAIVTETVGVRFFAPLGQTNRLMTSPDLVAWTQLEEIVGTGELIHRSVIVTNGNRYLRLIKP